MKVIMVSKSDLQSIRKPHKLVPNQQPIVQLQAKEMPTTLLIPQNTFRRSSIHSHTLITTDNHYLQRTIGNKILGQLITSHQLSATNHTCVYQPKLAITNQLIQRDDYQLTEPSLLRRNDQSLPFPFAGRFRLSSKQLHLDPELMQQNNFADISHFREPISGQHSLEKDPCADGFHKIGTKAREIHLNLRTNQVRIYTNIGRNYSERTFSGLITGPSTRELASADHWCAMYRIVAMPRGPTSKHGLLNFVVFCSKREIGFHSNYHLVRRGRRRVKEQIPGNMSAGCARIPEPNDRALYDLVNIGDCVRIYDRTNWRPPTFATCTERSPQC